MFDSTSQLLVLDQLRVPYRIGGPEPGGATTAARLEHLTVPDHPDRAHPEKALSWPALADGAPLAASAPAARLVRLGSLSFYARVLPTEALIGQLEDEGRPGSWRGVDPVLDLQGRQVSAICRSADGGIALPFDPNCVVRAMWTEGYLEADAAPSALLRSVAVHSYYRVRPLLPRRLQIALRRAYSHVQARSQFPAWPLEESLHGLYDTLLGWLAEIAGRPVPWMAPWPAGFEWALVLTHDVETSEGLTQMPVLREVEQRRGYVSCWNFVPKRYEVPQDVLSDLGASGCEVGLHGLYHDGRDLESARTLAERLPEMTRYAKRWGAVGFRSPATQRAWGLISSLPFEYDSSFPDTDPFEPQKGGCCSFWPLLNDEVVELPITLVQDHTLFVILRRSDAQLWLDKVDAIQRRGGMALIITHPDYVKLGPVAEAYEALLAHCAADPTLWRALPRDVSRWWWRRAQSRLEPGPDGWEVVGPAAGEATVRFTGQPQKGASSSSTTAR